MSRVGGWKVVHIPHSAPVRSLVLTWLEKALALEAKQAPWMACVLDYACADEFRFRMRGRELQYYSEGVFGAQGAAAYQDGPAVSQVCIDTRYYSVSGEGAADWSQCTEESVLSSPCVGYFWMHGLLSSGGIGFMLTESALEELASVSSDAKTVAHVYPMELKVHNAFNKKPLVYRFESGSAVGRLASLRKYAEKLWGTEAGLRKEAWHAFGHNGRSCGGCGEVMSVDVRCGPDFYCSHLCAQNDGWTDTTSVSDIKAQRASKFECASCGRASVDLLRCGHCRSVRYCNVKCQAADRQRHRDSCEAPKADSTAKKHRQIEVSLCSLWCGYCRTEPAATVTHRRPACTACAVKYEDNAAVEKKLSDLDAARRGLESSSSSSSSSSSPSRVDDGGVIYVEGVD